MPRASDRDPSWVRTVAQLGLKPEQFAFRTDSVLAQIEAVIAGVGIGGMHLGIAKASPSTDPGPAPSRARATEAWVVMHQDLRGSAAVRAVFDALCAALRAYCTEQ